MENVEENLTRQSEMLHEFDISKAFSSVYNGHSYLFI